MSNEVTGVEEVQAKLTALADSLTGAQMERKMHTVGNMLHNSIEESFETESGPFGEVWKPREKSKPGQSSKTLRDSGDLADRWMVNATPNEVVVSNNIAWYGIVHQWGTEKAGRKKDVVIMPRPFLPIDESGKLEPKLQEGIEGYLMDEIEKVLL